MHNMTRLDFLEFYTQTKEICKFMDDKAFLKFERLSDIPSETLDEIYDEVDKFINEWYHY